MKLERILSKSALFYSLYWLLYFVCFVAYRYSIQSKYIDGLNYTHSDAIRMSWQLNLVFLPLGIIITHIIAEILLPKLYFKNRVLLFSVIVGLIVLLAPMGAYFPAKYIVKPYILKTEADFFSYSVYIATSMKLLFCFIPIVWYKTSRFLRKKELNHQFTLNAKLESDLKLREAELKILRSQIHPHFLFNTLNNLYSLSIQKSEKTSEVIIKISDMLNYIIYECNAEKVSLEKELEFIRSYIDLEKLRYDDSLRINTSIVGDIQNKFIAPMILHTFIENSFKHGASKDTGNPWIDIHLTMNDNILNFTVINSKLNDDSSQTTGIGIENTIKRLQLIYPNRHTIEIANNKNAFNVSLELQL